MLTSSHSSSTVKVQACVNEETAVQVLCKVTKEVHKAQVASHNHYVAGAQAKHYGIFTMQFHAVTQAGS